MVQEASPPYAFTAEPPTPDYHRISIANLTTSMMEEASPPYDSTAELPAPPNYHRISLVNSTTSMMASPYDFTVDLPTLNIDHSPLLPNRSSSIYPMPPPRHYSLPPTFSIGKNHSPHLVNILQIKGHLALLNAFVSLKNQVQDLRWSGSGTVVDNHDLRWVWFVSLAVERFSIWCETLKPADLSKPATEFFPPIDVLLVWHTYMLNPRWYAEDCDRLPILRNMVEATKIFSKSLGTDLQAIITSVPRETRRIFWTSRTSRSFDAIEDARQQSFVKFSCPQCRKPVSSPYMNTGGTGYFQHNFQAFCNESTCPKHRPGQVGLSRVCIDRSLLRARKFIDDLFREGKDLQAYLAGSVRMPYLNIDLEKAKQIKSLVHDAVVQYIGQRPSGYSQNDWTALVLEKTIYRFEELQASVLRNTAEIDRPIVERVFSAYETERPFSVELVGAVIRQGSFIKRMEQLEWTKPNYFTDREDVVVLEHAIARYHAFLDILAANPRSLIVPTLDIDLAWHTHQLTGPMYNKECRDIIGRYVDHDDKVGESKLAISFDSTSALWKERFGLPYVYCGCPVPGKTIGKKLTNLFNSSSTSRIHSPPYLDPPDRSDIISATHPSDHNSVISIKTSQGRKHVIDDQFHRREKNWKLSQQISKKGPSKTMKGWTPSEDHEVAFLYPLPYNTHLSCASNDGHLDTGTTGIAACTSPSSRSVIRSTSSGSTVDYSDGIMTGYAVTGGPSACASGGDSSGASGCGSSCGGGGGGGCGGGN
ncbi:hypothetical protein H2248_006880 [Termitomyces sp. 'cryptogamus']|nr:hypothetical protein H2248_006880 [Termitomyces sp. 'cryptogamus']